MGQHHERVLDQLLPEERLRLRDALERYLAQITSDAGQERLPLDFSGSGS